MSSAQPFWKRLWQRLSGTSDVTAVATGAVQPDDVRVFNAIARWCGQQPASGSELLEALWDRTQGIPPFRPAGADRLIQELDAEFRPRTLRLRAVDVIGCSVDALVAAIPPVSGGVA